MQSLNGNLLHTNEISSEGVNGMADREETLRELEWRDNFINAMIGEIAAHMEIELKNLYYHKVENNLFKGAGIIEGDYIILFNKYNPRVGFFSLLKYRNKNQLVWIIGEGLTGNPIVARRYNKYPLACELPINKCVGEVIAIIRDKQIMYI